MRILVALGGNALLRRGQPPTTEAQRANVRTAVAGLVPLARDHELVVSHGNGPQVGLLALQAAAGPDGSPLDVLGAESEGMIGYLIEQELVNRLPEDVPVATILTMVEVDPHDAAFAEPTKFVGPLYEQEAADALRASHGWTFRRDGAAWRRVVPSPIPLRIVELRPIRWLLEHGALVICAGGGGIPVARNDDALVGVEAVIDKDRASELLAGELDVDLFVMATDVDGVYAGWGTPDARRVDRVTPAELRALDAPAGSMGPKVEAAARFVEATGRRAVIGALTELEALVAGTAGTHVLPATPPPPATESLT